MKQELPGHARQSVNFGVNVNSQTKVATIVAKMGIEARYEQADFDPAIQVRGSFGITIGIIKPFSSDAALEEALQRTCVLVVWPYWREFVNSMTTRMGLPPLPIPLANFDELTKPKPKLEKPKS